MGDVVTRPVRSAKERRTFITFPWRIYRDDPLWVPPLTAEREKTIDPERGAFFKRGEAELFLAWQNGRPVGTICTGEDKSANEYLGAKDCIFGFLECVPDYAVAQALFRQAIQWARDRGLEALLGPFNLDHENSYGLLIDGQDRPPTLFCGHTPPYYQDFVARFGFEPARADNLAYAIDVDADTPPLRRLSRLAKQVRERGRILVRGADLTQWDAEVDRVLLLLNSSLSHLAGHTPWQREELIALLEPFRDFADAELILFAEIDGQAVGWFPGLPNLNEVLIHVNGLRHPWDYLKMWKYGQRQPACLTVKSVVVLPEYWGTGVSVLLFDEMVRRARARGFKWVDLSLTSEDNPNTTTLAERVGAKIYKRYRVYRLEFGKETEGGGRFMDRPAADPAPSKEG